MREGTADESRRGTLDGLRVRPTIGGLQGSDLSPESCLRGRNLPGKQGVARELLKAREPWTPGPLQRTPPQVALVGIGRITERPWTVDGMLAVRRALFLRLAGDRCASDGRRDGRSSALSHPT